ncbi:hypothetical protein DFJ73DRAFT_852751 [Zopfochytrium polystomum]|nr:hypothetical protein DFJ73DRAFT_852751 [Zopfochytrium polystomum]
MIPTTLLAALLAAAVSFTSASPAPIWIYKDDAPDSASPSFGNAAAAAAAAAAPALDTPPAPSQPPLCRWQSTTAPFAIPTGSDGKPLVFSFDEAKAYCGKNGLYGLSAENSGNQYVFEQVLAQCVGSYKKAWISSWNTDTYGGYPLFTMLRTDGDVNAKSGVYVDITNTERMPAFCTTSART